MPMGTIMAAIMLLALVFAVLLMFKRSAVLVPAWLAMPIGVLSAAGGLWNVFWYWLRHITEFWGIAALASGLLMLLTAAYLMAYTRLPAIVRSIRPLVLLGLFACMMLYGITIYRL